MNTQNVPGSIAKSQKLLEVNAREIVMATSMAETPR